MKIIYTDILNIYENGLNDSYDRTNEIGENSARIYN